MIIDDKLLNEVSQKAKESPRLRMNHNFHESLESTTQRLLNALEIGTILPVHRHQDTDETYILLRGMIKVIFYDKMGVETEYFELNPKNGAYGVHIPKGQWHTLEVLENDSIIFEVKDGPYKPLTEEDILR